jgi:hypothetical protein
VGRFNNTHNAPAEQINPKRKATILASWGKHQLSGGASHSGVKETHRDWRLRLGFAVIKNKVTFEAFDQLRGYLWQKRNTADQKQSKWEYIPTQSYRPGSQPTRATSARDHLPKG